MADNDFYTPERLSGLTLAALNQELVLPRLVSRDAEADFAGSNGTVVNMRVPATVTGGGARTYTQTQRDDSTPIVLDRIEETTVPVTMGPQIYKGVPITDAEATFEVAAAEYESRIITPLAQVVATGVEGALTTIVNGVTADEDITASTAGTDLHEAIIAMRQALNSNNVPFGGRTLAVSPEIESLLLIDQQDRLVRYDASGSAEALRNATIGRLYGFEVVVAPDLTANSMVAFQRDAFGLAVRAPTVPRGVTWGASTTYQGIALRVHQDYDTAFLQDRVIVSAFAGAVVLDARRVVRVVATTPTP